MTLPRQLLLGKFSFDIKKFITKFKRNMHFIQGQTRLVILTKNYAIKLPNFLKSYRQFLYGLVSNLQELNYQHKSPYLLPVQWSSYFGIVLVFKRVKPLNMMLSKIEFNKIVGTLHGYPKIDFKLDSFGFLNGQVYIIDYGTTV